MSKTNKTSKRSMSPDELSKQLASLSPPSPLLRDESDAESGFRLTPPVFSDLSSAPSTLSKNSLGSISTTSSKKGLTPINISGLSSVSSAPSASASASGKSYLSTPSSYVSKADIPLSAKSLSSDISFSPLLPSPSPSQSQSISSSATGSVSSIRAQPDVSGSVKKFKKSSVLVPVRIPSSSSNASSTGKSGILSQPSTIFSLTPTLTIPSSATQTSTSSTSSTSSASSAPSIPAQQPLQNINIQDLPTLPDISKTDISLIPPPPPPQLPGATAPVQPSSVSSDTSSFGSDVAVTPTPKSAAPQAPEEVPSEPSEPPKTPQVSPVVSPASIASVASFYEKESPSPSPQEQQAAEQAPVPLPEAPVASPASPTSPVVSPVSLPAAVPSPATPSPPTPGEETIMQAIEDESFLYPTLDDPDFNIKIAEKREFADTTYDGKVYDSMKKIKEYANKMCNADFELSPHQLFVRNFLSIQTPYNSLLLYHGLGTGKTCSAITICEEMRDYLVNIGMSSAKKIIIVASPNVQQNFKLQLFDSRKLKLIDGVWNIRSCTGNKYLKEINPMNMKGMDEEKVVKEIKKIIKNSYMFLGYDQFASLIQKTSTIDDSIEDKVQRYKLMNQKLKVVFGNSLIVIDEFHNIRNTSDNSTNRAVANELQKLVKFGPSLLTRLLLLSGTPMYNSYREIVWLLNIMRLNDGRATINYRDVFNDNPDDGIFVESIDENGAMTETGRDNLRRFSTGYVSYVRGENPYTFPYRIYPDEFAPMQTFAGIEETRETGEGREPTRKIKYQIPEVQISGTTIPIHRRLDMMQDKIYLTEASPYQQSVYSYVIRQLQKSNKEDIKNMERNDQAEQTAGITLLQRPLECLNITYPADDFDPAVAETKNYDIRGLVGKYGLRRVMDFDDETKSGYSYRENVPHVFAPENIGNYSSKIKSICDNIYKSEGITLIYSFYIDGGVVPIALALESMGFSRYGAAHGHSLFSKPPAPPIDAITGKRRNEMAKGETFFPAKYIVISGDKNLSPDNIGEVKAVTNDGNYDGRFIKAIIISKSGTEGIDFKNIRQTHILEPWYNINLVEQTIGRAVRNCSHKNLEFEKRNVQIFLHGSVLTLTPNVEAADIYLYRLSERKAKQIGEVSRVLKESAVDCLLNIDQTNFTEENFSEALGLEADNQIIQILSSYDAASASNIQIPYHIGDKDYSSTCDYMECLYECKPTTSRKNIGYKKDIFTDTILTMNTDKIVQRIRDIFRERYFYKRTATSKKIDDISSDLIATINYNKKYPIEAIDIALTQLIEDKNEFIIDKYGRYGRLVNIGNYYFFQPLELNNPIIPLRDRQRPVDFKRDKIIFAPQKKQESVEDIRKKYESRMKESARQKILSRVSEEKMEGEGEAEGEGEERARVMGGLEKVGETREAREAREMQQKLENEYDTDEENLMEMISSFRREPKLLKKLRKYYDIATKEQKSERGKTDWYHNVGFVLKNKLNFIPERMQKEFIVAHILQELNSDDILTLLNWGLNADMQRVISIRESNPIKYEFDILMDEYYKSLVLEAPSLRKNGVLLISKKGELELYIRDEELGRWTLGSKPDFKYFNPSILAKFFIPKETIGNTLAPYIGFITNISTGNYSAYVFKTKQIVSSGASLGAPSSVVKGSSIAARCDQAGRAKIVSNLLLILTEERMTRILSRMSEQESRDYIDYELENEFKEILRKEGKLENSPAIKRLLTILGYSYETFLDMYQRKILSFEIDFTRMAKLFINRTKLVTPHIMETEVENESKKLSSAVAAVVSEKSKSKRPEKDITTSKTIKSMLNIINYPEQQFLQEYKSKTLNYDGIHFPFSIKNNRNTTEVELCILQEFLLRFYDREREESKRWFFSPVEVLLNSI